MSSVFERVATSFGSTWKDQLSDEMEEFITRLVTGTVAATPYPIPPPSITEDPDVAGAYWASSGFSADPIVAGAYLIGE